MATLVAAADLAGAVLVEHTSFAGQAVATADNAAIDIGLEAIAFAVIATRCRANGVDTKGSDAIELALTAGSDRAFV